MGLGGSVRPERSRYLLSVSVIWAVLCLPFGFDHATAACAYPPGDIDGVGSTEMATVADVQCAILAGLWTQVGSDAAPPSCLADGVIESADVNCSGAVNVADVQLTIAHVLGVALPTAIDADSDGCVDACAEIEEPPDDGSDGEFEPPGWEPICSMWAEESHPNCLLESELFACGADTPPASSPARIRRINRNELVRASGLGVLMAPEGYNPNPLKNNPLNPASHLEYSTYAEGVTIDSTTLDLLLQVIDKPGVGWTTKWWPVAIGPVNTDSEFNCIFNHDNPSADCRDYWLKAFIEQGLLYRPATPDEYARLSQRLNEALAAEASEGISREETLSRVVSGAWLLPEALFRNELGQDEQDEFGRHRLTDAELGKMVAYLLSDYGPGASVPLKFQCCGESGSWPVPPNEGYLADVRAAVADGSIQDPAVISALVHAHASGVDSLRVDLAVEQSASGPGTYRDNRGDYWMAPKVVGFFRQWLGYDAFPNEFKDSPLNTSRFLEPGTTPPGLSAYAGNSAFNQLKSGYYSHFAGKEGTMVQQLDDLIARAVYEDTDVLEQLLTTRHWYVPSSGHGIPCTQTQECVDACVNGLDPADSGYPDQVLGCQGSESCHADGYCKVSDLISVRWVTLPYDIDTPVAATDADRWRDLPVDERAGVLTHPAWLAAHGDAFEDGPSAVHRGKWIREKLLCEYIPPLSKVQGVAAMVGPSAPEKSARDRLVEATHQPFCWGCHRRMNTLGFAFEQYNHAGFLRAWDHAPDVPNNKGPVDAFTSIGGSYPDIAGAPYTFDGPDDLSDPTLHGSYPDAVALAEALAGSQRVKRCFVRQAFRYFAGRDETPQDACTLGAMEAAYDDKGSFVDMIAALATSDTLLYRTRDTAATCE